MVDQEYILGLIQKEKWKPVLDFLYNHKEAIRSDSLLQYTTSIFETEFFSKLNKDSLSITLEDLEKLILLHHGSFFTLSDNNYEILICKLAILTTGKESYEYARKFPENVECKKIINKFSNLQNLINLETKKDKNMNWIEIYNRLFEAINVRDDASTYFSGPRFINTLKEFLPYHPDYGQYITIRNENGKSTSRKIFYYDLLMDLEEPLRIQFVTRILEMINPFIEEKATPIRMLLEGQEIINPIEEKPVQVKDDGTPTVFISYSWDSEEHKKWVLDLANKLLGEGVNILLDRFELRLGKSLPHFVETSIRTADRILIVFTPNYKIKAEKRAGGVGYEYSIMNAELYKNQVSNERIIPILRDGTSIEGIPEFMQQYIHLDMTNDEKFENSYTDLLREIYDEPEIVKPAIGTKRKIASS